jgi:hypothetical protein
MEEHTIFKPWARAGVSSILETNEGMNESFFIMTSESSRQGADIHHILHPIKDFSMLQSRELLEFGYLMKSGQLSISFSTAFLLCVCCFARC